MRKSVTIIGEVHKILSGRKLPDDRWGDYEPGKIRITKGAPTLQANEALLHEMFHGLEHAYGFEMNHDHLTLLARGLCIVMRENQGLAAEIFGE